MQKSVLKSILLLALISVLGACFYDNEEELYPTVNCVTTNLSYSAEILPIIRNNCYTCHAADIRQGNINLEGYAALKVMADNGRLKSAINHQTGFAPMPQGAPKLSDCQLNQIGAWINDGAPNN